MTVSEKHIKAAQNIMDDACLPVRLYENGVVRTMQKAIAAALAAAEREGREDERRRCAEIAERWTPFPEPTSRAARYWLKHVARPSIARAILSQAGEA